jgi:hypothetical protein
MGSGSRSAPGFHLVFSLCVCFPSAQFSPILLHLSLRDIALSLRLLLTTRVLLIVRSPLVDKSVYLVGGFANSTLGVSYDRVKDS